MDDQNVLDIGKQTTADPAHKVITTLSVLDKDRHCALPLATKGHMQEILKVLITC